jgi:mono/diheme cytochrome c family protein
MSPRTLLLASACALSMLGLGAALFACTSSGNAAAGSAAAAAPSPAAGASGATLWAQNCGHCHNLRSPDSYGDAQWDVVALHMRVRANLTAPERTQILAFLRSAH